MTSDPGASRKFQVEIRGARIRIPSTHNIVQRQGSTGFPWCLSIIQRTDSGRMDSRRRGNDRRGWSGVRSAACHSREGGNRFFFNHLKFLCYWNVTH